MTDTTVQQDALTDLGDALAGSLHLPGSAEYQRLATPWNVAVASRPIAVAAVADADDVVLAVRWAAKHRVRVAVRATGHGAAAELDGVLLVHTGRLDQLSIDADGRARIGAGLTWNPVLEAAAARGLAPVLGSSPGVGVVGFLTGGGVGPISRTYGLGSDRVHAFEIVTGDGHLRRASATEHRSLFWALRGGKGALGIVTAVEVDLVPLPTLLGGALFFDGADAERVLSAWASWSADLPEEATTSVAILRLPPMPGVPEPIAGRTTLSVRYAWVGDEAVGETVLAPMRDVAPVVFGGVGRMPAAVMGMIHADPVDPMPSLEAATMLHEFPQEAVDELVALAGPDADAPQVIVEVRRLGGAVARPDAVGDVVWARDTAYTVMTIGIGLGPGVPATIAHADRVMAAMDPWSTGKALPNFAPGTDPERVLRLYERDALARLGTVVATYDPDLVVLDAEPVRAACMLALG